MLNLKTPFILLYVFTSSISYLNAQAPNLTVEGWAKIEGERLEFSNDENSNIFIGFECGTQSNSSAQGNISLGYQSLGKLFEGKKNTGIGYQTLVDNTNGNSNSAIGAHAMQKNTIGYQNTAVGVRSLENNTEGILNTATGFATLFYNQEGSFNTANGARALLSNATGRLNTATGYRALFDNVQGDNNAAFGDNALHENLSGSSNTAIGSSALFSNFTGTNNTAVGYHAFYSGQFYFNSTAIGYGTDISSANQIRLGNASVTSIGGFEPWTNLSDKRLKKNVKNDIPGLEFITQLQPVTYQLDMERIAKWQNTPDSLRDHKSEVIKGNIRYSGFLAQEVETAAKAIDYDFSGIDQPKNVGDRYGIRYSQFVVPLVKAVQELNEEKEDAVARIQKLETEIAALKALLGDKQKVVELRHTDKPKEQKATLSQNRPNPFNGKTTINYYIPDNFQQAMLRIADSTGRLVRDIKIYQGGAGQIELEAGTLSEGSYFYYLILDGQIVEHRQMVLLK